MRSLLWVCLLGLECVALTGEEEWQLVFPENYRLGQDHVLLSIGAKVYADRPNEYLIGSQSGWVFAAILGEPEQSTSWSPVKLPFDLDISAIDVVNDQWIIGLIGDSGISTGQVAIHHGANSDLSDLSENWELRLLDPNLEVRELACIGDTVLALLVGNSSTGTLHRSTDGGLNWEVVPEITDVGDVEVFQGKFYLIRSGETGAELVVSGDGVQYDSVWTITDSHGSVLWHANLSVMDMATDTLGLPTGDDLRLYINGNFDYTYTPNGNYFTGVRSRFYLSSPDGVTWFDHGSTTTTWWTPGHSFFDPDPWNPLSVPEAYEYMEWPLLLMHSDTPVQSAGNFSLEWGYSTTRGLTQFDGDAPHLVNSLDDGKPRIRGYTISQWGELAFVYFDQPDQARFVTVGKGGGLSEQSLPDSESKIRSIQQMITVGGTTYVEVDSMLLTTTNFQQWNIQSWPEGLHSLDLTSDGSHLFGLSSQNRDVTSFQLNDDWIPGFEYAYKSPSALAFVEHSDSWYHALPYPDDVRVFQLGETGEWEILCAMVPDEDWPVSAQMVCPDGQRLIVFGKTAELLIVETNGSWRSAFPWQSIAPDVDSIGSVWYANGWYYVLGEVTARTRDFFEFESVTLPDDEPLIHVTMFDGQIYGFTPNAVFKMPCEKGFLDSVEPKPGWHHANWLGWFQIIDEDLGDIDHLLLGQCWVIQISDLEYWIRTASLGWIWINKDWSPWFWRMDNGHWYWLDHDSWPPRAWDYEDQEWEEL